MLKFRQGVLLTHFYNQPRSGRLSNQTSKDAAFLFFQFLYLILDHGIYFSYLLNIFLSFMD
jgi:hypothetical protein